MAQSKPPSRWGLATSLCLLLFAFLAVSLPPARAQEQQPVDGAAPDVTDVDGASPTDPMALPADPADQQAGALPPGDASALDLQLDVKINGYAMNLVAGFRQMPDGRIASQRSELGEIGIAVPGDGAAGELIVLDDLPGLSYVYDETNQVIELEVPDSLRIAKHLSSTGGIDFQKAESGLGLAVNYTAFGAASYVIPQSSVAFDGANLSLDARAFSKFGTLRQSGIVGTTAFTDANLLRLDTTWSYADQESMRNYRLGDIVSGGLRWTRPIRLGGAQVQRNFGLRPDLITIPLPSIKGTAEVPSVLDIYVDNAKAYTGDLEPGPFSFDDLPVFSDSGVARMVLTDATGRSIETQTPFFTSPNLLKSGLFDYSLEAGFVRRNFGTQSFDYDEEPAGLLSARYGLADWLTLEGHAEGKADLIDAGLGATLSARQFGTFSGAVAASKFGKDEGLFVYGSWQARFGDLSIYASTSRRFGDYYDLAAATATPLKGQPLTTNVPEAVDQISLGYTIPGINAGTGLSLIHQKMKKGEETLLLSGSLAKPFDNGVSLFASGYWDFLDSKGYGAYLGVSVPLGKRISASAAASATHGSWNARAEVARPMSQDIGDYGWRVSHTEGSEQRASDAYGVYRSKYGVAEGNLYQQEGQVSGNAAFSGALAMAGGSVFASNTIQDSFAVVKAQSPGVKVSFENTYAGDTGKNGKLLLPNLRSFQKNRISIDVNDLPITASAEQADVTVVPREAAGVVVDFGVKADAAGVLVTLVDDAGKPLPAGLETVLNGEGDPFVIGYDGEVYVTGVRAQNDLQVTLASGACQVSFGYQADGTGQTAIGPLTCAAAQ